jgi:hypothetical protein
MTTKYISIKSVLYGISLLIDDRYWNENKVLEWVNRGYRKMDLSPSFVTKTAELTVTSHKTTLPSDFKYLIQIMDTTDVSSVDTSNLLDESLDPPSNST